MRKLNWLGFFCVAFITQESLAAWKADRENLERMTQYNEIRLFYSLKGKDALPTKNQLDVDKNGIPDYIENIGLRLVLASKIFEQSFKLVHPLQNTQYKGKAKYIDVHFLNRVGHGSTGDAIHQFNYKYLDLNQDQVVSIKLSTDLRKGTFTPVHEMFHVYQNGYTLFKNRWYTEGTARWAEYAQKKGTGSRKILPKTIEELDDILTQTYDTKYFWRRLAYLFDYGLLHRKGVFNDDFVKHNQIIGYPKVIEDNRLYGISFIKTFLEKLDEMDDVAAFSEKLDKYNWPEKRQKSEKNNPYILCALKLTIARERRQLKILNRGLSSKHNQEINQFLVILDKRIIPNCFDINN